MALSVYLDLMVEDDADLVSALELAAQEDATVRVQSSSPPPTDGFAGQIEPITTMLVSAAAVVALAKFAADWWERRKGGLVIDQCVEPTQLRRDSDLPYGYVVTVAADGGPVKVDVKDAPKDAVERLLETLLGQHGRSAGAIAATVRELGFSSTQSV